MAYSGTPISAYRSPAGTYTPEVTIAGWMWLNTVPVAGRTIAIRVGLVYGGIRIAVENPTSHSRMEYRASVSDTRFIDYTPPAANEWTHMSMYRRLEGAAYVFGGHVNGNFIGEAESPTPSSTLSWLLEVTGFHGAVCDICCWKTYVPLNFSAIVEKRMSAALQSSHALVCHRPLIRDTIDTRSVITLSQAGSAMGQAEHPVRTLSR